jgi:hypothetical protein
MLATCKLRFALTDVFSWAVLNVRPCIHPLQWEKIRSHFAEIKILIDESNVGFDEKSFNLGSILNSLERE